MKMLIPLVKMGLPILLLLEVSSCSLGSGGGSDEDSNIVSEIDEATQEISGDENSSASADNLSGGDQKEAEEKFQSEYEQDSKSGDSEMQDEKMSAKNESDEFSDEEFKDEDLTAQNDESAETTELAENKNGEEDFNDFEDTAEGSQNKDENVDREIAQNDEPKLEALDESAAKSLNEPPDEQAKKDSSYPDATVENPQKLLAQENDNKVEDPSSNTEIADNNTTETTRKSWIPVKKIKTEPFYQNGRLMNTVYIVRTDKDLNQISHKIFGENRTKILIEDNPHLAKGIKTGDKLYYNSPSRPNDSSSMKVAYEDIGSVAQEYVTKAGDNIRTFSEKILGFPDAWKEVWATNKNIESKDQVEEGVNLRYWRDDIGSLNTKLAGSSHPSELDAAAVTQDFNSHIEDPKNPTPPAVSSGNINNQNLSMQSPQTDEKNSSAPILPTETPQMAEIEPPPPLPPPQPTTKNDSVGGSAGHNSGSENGLLGGLGNDNTTLVYVALGLIAAVALFIKKKKASRPPSVFEATQV